ncbi:MAG: phage tail tape measure protein [Bacteroidales bacterium]
MAATTNRRINIYINDKEVENKIGGITAAYTRLNREIKQCEVGSDAYNKKAAEIQTLKGHIDAHNVAIGKTASNWDKLRGSIVQTAIGVLGGNLLTSITTGLMSSVSGMIDGAKKISDQFADIQKTTGMSAQGVEELNKGLKKIDTRTAVSELRNIAIVAGQLGIEKEKVLGFTDAVDKINVALGDEIVGGADVVAETVGKLRNVLTDMKSDAVDQDLLKIGNALNELGAAGFATAPVVADLSNRIGSIAIPLGMTSAQVMGLAATFQELNISEERGGTAMGKILQKMTQNTGTFAKIAGMDVKSFTKLVNNDLYGAFMKVVEGSKSGGSAATTLSGIIKELEVNGAGASEVFMKLSGNAGMANEKIALAEKALQGTDSVMNEFNLKNNNFAGQMEKAGKVISGYFASITQAVAPVIAKVVTGFVDLLGWIKNNSSAILFLGKTLLVSATAYVSYGAAVKLVAFLTKSSTEATLFNMVVEKTKMAIEKTSTALLYLKCVAYDVYKGKISLATAATEAFNLTTKASPAGLIVAGITAAATAYMLFKNSLSSTSKSAGEFFIELQKERTALDNLFEVVKKTSAGTKERKEGIDKINEVYGKYLPQLLTEKSSLDEINIAQVQANKALREKIALKMQETQINEIVEKSINKQKDLISGLVSGAESSKGSAAAGLFQSELNDLIKLSDNDYSAASIAYTKLLAKYHMSLTGSNLHDFINIHKARVEEANDLKNLGDFYTAFLGKKTEILSIDEQITRKRTELARAESKDEKKAIQEEIDLLLKKNTVKSGKKDNGYSNDPTDEEKKAAEELQKELIKLREEQKQAYLDADSKELENVDIKYKELIKKAGNDGKAIAEINKYWLAEKERVEISQFTKKMKRKNEEIDQEQEETKKAKQKELKDLEDSLAKAGTIKLNSIKQDYIDGKIDKKEFDEKTKQLEIAQLKMLIELKQKYKVDTLALEAELQDKLVALLESTDKANNKDKSGFFDNLFEIDEFKITERFKRVIDEISQMVGELSNIWGGVLQIQANNEEEDFRTYKKSQDLKKKELDKRLKSGLISQAQYDDGIAEIDKESDARQKQMAYDQAKREKTLAVFNAVINTAVAFTKALPNLILAGIVAAAGAVQVAAIASEPLPELAAGGYTDGVSIAGEKGKEWVASNTLLRNPVTAPVISWLEDYQRGKTRQPLPPAYDQISTAIQNRQSSGVAQSNKNLEVLILQLISQNNVSMTQREKLNDYLSDPNNRKARIVRDELTKFDDELSTLKELARIGK